MQRQTKLIRIHAHSHVARPSRAKASLRRHGRTCLWPVVVATLVALRALVPVGYMLSLPGDGSFDWALHLCPVQNRSLDVSLFQSHAVSELHDHARDSNTDGTGARTRLAVSGECTAWLDSATPVLAASLTVPGRVEPAAITFVDPDGLVAGRLRRQSAQPRAPPANA